MGRLQSKLSGDRFRSHKGQIWGSPAPIGVGALGILLGGLVVLHLFVTHFVVMATESNAARFALETVEIFLMVGPPLFLFIAASWIHRQHLSNEQQWHILQWTVGGTLLVGGVIGLIQIHTVLSGHPIHAGMVEMELLIGTGVGGVLGFISGWRGVQNRQVIGHLEAQRDAFRFLNRALRHHILNDINVIDGNAELLETGATIDAEGTASIGAIRSRSQSIVEFVETVGVVMSTFEGSPSLKPVNLSEIVSEELAMVRSNFENVAFQSDLPQSATVSANDLLGSAVINLLENAAQYNAAIDPHVDVSLSDDEHGVTLRIADNGPGINPDEIASLLKPGATGDRGMGLYLIQRLIEQYGGQLTIEGNDPTGTVVTMSLPAHSAK